MVELPLNFIPTENNYLIKEKNINYSLHSLNNFSNNFLLADILKASALFLLVLWTILANFLVFIVLYKNPRLQTVPNLLVGNLALSDFCLALIVLPLSSVYACAGEWLFNETLCQIFVSADILCSTASIWNLSIVGLDRYWAITSPVAYLNKRNKKTACLMIVSVWSFSALISLAPLLGWKQVAKNGNLVKLNGTWQCTFLDLPSYTIYSATGSFFIPTLLMFFVYFKVLFHLILIFLLKIYQAFAKHRARQIYRQKVIRKHIESTILHEISHILPTSDEFAKDVDEDDEDDEGVVVRPVFEEEEGEYICRETKVNDSSSSLTIGVLPLQHSIIYEEEEEENLSNEESIEKEEYSNEEDKEEEEDIPLTPTTIKRQLLLQSRKQWRSFVENSIGKQNINELDDSSQQTKTLTKQQQQQNIIKTLIKKRNSEGTNDELNNSNIQQQMFLRNKNGKIINGNQQTMPTYEKVRKHKRRKELNLRKSLQTRPRTISAAKERRGVRVLGIILGCFTLCWTPFFMYVLKNFLSLGWVIRLSSSTKKNIFGKKSRCWKY
ncbi:G_PROTEIN_RECEP_F1_2 domain-containing protein [Meloidogyne graminicola]|uniref:G_PROTEIN_RECEP_F1_2 domain-containing protein n=1 Tax=Meloidogyne graminicola TaxID=189291 RepID=A0A8S9ZQ73_9BILA|nr:G_PROTEIN_RECEP_F1_2 domain-containing protein [Meloidogyne graminicola]